MANILQTTFSNAFHDRKWCYFDLLFKVQLTISQQMAQLMDWHLAGDESLFEPTATDFTDTDLSP